MCIAHDEHGWKFLGQGPTSGDISSDEYDVSAHGTCPCMLYEYDGYGCSDQSMSFS